MRVGAAALATPFRRCALCGTPNREAQVNGKLIAILDFLESLGRKVQVQLARLIFRLSIPVV